MMCIRLLFIKKHIRSTTKLHSRCHEFFCELIPPNKTSTPPIEKASTTNREFLSKFWMSSPPAQT